MRGTSVHSRGGRTPRSSRRSVEAHEGPVLQCVRTSGTLIGPDCRKVEAVTRDRPAVAADAVAEVAAEEVDLIPAHLDPARAGVKPLDRVAGRAECENHVVAAGKLGTPPAHE